MKTFLLSLLIFASCATAALAAPLPGADSHLPVDVTADNMVYNADKNTVVFQGRVEAVRGEFKMWSETLTLYLTSKGDTKEADSHRPCQAEDHPGHTNTTRMDNSAVHPVSPSNF